MDDEYTSLTTEERRRKADLARAMGDHDTAEMWERSAERWARLDRIEQEHEDLANMGQRIGQGVGTGAAVGCLRTFAISLISVLILAAVAR
jgi:tetrahydromethanopterin S-methyltransferase subunit G